MFGSAWLGRDRYALFLCGAAIAGLIAVAPTCSVYTPDLTQSGSGGTSASSTESSSESSSASTGGSMSSSSSSGMGGGGGAGGSGGSGGLGCMSPAMCPDTMNECIKPVCTAGQCGTMNVADGTKIANQKPGDCQVVECDGNGATKSVADDNDLPDDNIACTDDVCTMGVPSNPPLASGTSCGNGLVCDGNGMCVGCTMPTQCPGQDDECETRTCSNGNCGFSFTPNGTAVMMQTSADCKQNVCNGNGQIVSQNDNGDVFVDGLTCTADQCSNGMPVNPPVMAGTPCNQMGGQLCDGFGSCVQCLVSTDCPGVDTECAKRTCSAGTCGTSFTAAGTAVMSQVTGDCKTNVCDGLGGFTTQNDDLDVPVDNIDCTIDDCTNGVPSNPFAPPGTPCNQMGGTACNATGQCVVVPVSCNDLIKNGSETDVDCGGGTCPACPDFKACIVANDCIAVSCIGGKCESAWINEIHYDNAGSDVNEGVEIAGSAGLDLTGWSVVLYNGSNGMSYAPLVSLSGVIPNQQASKGTLTFPALGMQNGAPDGLALVAPGNVVIQFLSYEGVFVATNGAALGIQSIDIGVSELGTEPIGQSLQLIGTGSKYTDFAWTGPAAASFSAVNAGQTFN